MLAQGEGKRRSIWPHQINSTFLNEGPSPRHRVKGKRTKCKHSKLKVRSSMKAPDAPVDGVRESKENTLDIFSTGLILNESRVRTQCSRRAARNDPTWGCLGTPGSGQGRNQPQGTPKGVCQKGLGVFCTRGVKGELKHGTPCRDPSPPDSEPFGLSHERQSAGQWRWVQKNMKRVRFSVFLPHTRT